MTKFSRGHLKSYPINDISRRIRSSLNEGVKEVWLTSQDTFCYGYDRNVSIIELIKNIFQTEKNFKLRIGMGNPEFLCEYISSITIWF